MLYPASKEPCMENLIILLMVLGVLVAVIGLFARQAGARRRLMKPLPERQPVLDTTTAALQKPPTIDAAVAVAIASAVNAITPGARITRIEEKL
jgi:hypothetical protein